MAKVDIAQIKAVVIGERITSAHNANPPQRLSPSPSEHPYWSIGFSSYKSPLRKHRMLAFLHRDVRFTPDSGHRPTGLRCPHRRQLDDTSDARFARCLDCVVLQCDGRGRVSRNHLSRTRAFDQRTGQQRTRTRAPHIHADPMTVVRGSDGVGRKMPAIKCGPPRWSEPLLRRVRALATRSSKHRCPGLANGHIGRWTNQFGLVARSDVPHSPWPLLSGDDPLLPQRT